MLRWYDVLYKHHKEQKAKGITVLRDKFDKEYDEYKRKYKKQ